MTADAVDYYQLGSLDTPPEEVFANHRRFRAWAPTVLDPAARTRRLTGCEMCQRHVKDLPTYRAA